MNPGGVLLMPTLPRTTALACANRRRDPERCSFSGYGTFGPRPVLVSELDEESPIFTRPFVSPLLFENSTSDARDHCANERNFLSWLRLSMYLAIISIAITLTFHIRTPPTALESKISVPLGVVFWVLAVLSLLTGLGNYFSTVENYRTKEAVVQTSHKTQIIVAILSFTIIGTCVFFLVNSAP